MLAPSGILNRIIRMDYQRPRLADLSEPERARLGERLRVARERAQLTQSEAAMRLGVTQATISRFETGERGLEVAELIVLAKLYGVGPTWFLEDGQPPG